MVRLPPGLCPGRNAAPCPFGPGPVPSPENAEGGILRKDVDTYGKKKAAPGACAEGLGGSERRAAQHPRVRARADVDGRGHVAAHRRREG